MQLQIPTAVLKNNLVFSIALYLDHILSPYKISPFTTEPIVIKNKTIFSHNYIPMRSIPFFPPLPPRLQLYVSCNKYTLAVTKLHSVTFSFIN